MVCKRQKLARKRFKEANPDLLLPPPAPSLTTAGEQQDDKKKNKKKSNKLKALKAKKKIGAKSNEGVGGGGRRKHPLRIPGMRPGESCYICKSEDHIAKFCPEKAQWEKNKICLLCRQRGHSLKNCPENNDNDNKKLCYNCGEHGHSLFKCPKPIEDGGTKFAVCFVCKEHGHLSKNCSKNKLGVYPKGGSCKVCGEVTHLAKFCPNKGNKSLTISSGQLHQSDNSRHNSRRLLNIHRSGDDLEDDFMEEPVISGKMDVTSNSNSESAASNGKIEENMQKKPKKKQGPKVVNFLS